MDLLIFMCFSLFLSITFKKWCDGFLINFIIYCDYLQMHGDAVQNKDELIKNNTRGG